MRLDLNTKLRENFYVREFVCKCGCGFGLELEHYDQDFLDFVQRVRDRISRPLFINSGLRCVAHNKAEGGVEFSAHTRALACDFKVSGSYERHELVKAGLAEDALGIGVAKTFIHLDTDGSGLLVRPGVWSY